MSLANYYPVVKYRGTTSVNLLVEVEVLRTLLNDRTKYFTYVVKQGERPDIVAEHFYSDPTMDWVVFLVNGIVDPYKDWPLDEKQLISYLESKYNTAIEKLTTTTIENSIAYYYYKGNYDDLQDYINSFHYTMTPTTYAALGNPAGWVAKSIWDYENELNESKREIKILRSEHINDFKQQVKDLFIDG